MAEQGTPRQRVKAMVRGELPVRPLLLPVVFALGSRLENLALRDFMGNPTKIANALRQIRSVLKVDGLACYWDPLLEIEALTSTDAKSVEQLRQRVDAAGGIAKMGRVRVAVEVLQRLKVMLKDEPALMVRVTGPQTLASQLGAPSEGLEFAAEITASLVQSYLEAGADVVLLAENALPTKDFERWRALVDPVINLIRFFETFPVLWFEQALSPEDLKMIRKNRWDCAISLNGLPQAIADGRGVASLLGLSMQGLDLLRSEDQMDAWAASILADVATVGASFLTSPDPPATCDLRALGKTLSAIRGHLVSAA
jgi:hypothetical protein